MKQRCGALVIAILALGTGCAPARAASPSVARDILPAPGGGAALRTDTTRLTVSGSATVRAPADRARLQVAVETEGATAEVAARENASVMARVVDRVRGVLGADGPIETSGYRLTPRYAQPTQREAPPEIAGYQAINQLTVVVETVDRVGELLDAALEAGANRVTGLDFFASDTEALRLEALREAMARAQAEAETVADALGLVLLTPEHVQTRAGSAGQAFRVSSEALAIDTPIEVGSESVTASVTITYRLVPGGRP